MTFDVHCPYPGTTLIVTRRGSVLLGVPTDAFKATKRYCQERDLPFPRVLVAPQKLLVAANPQFAPEFFLYDFLFVYGAAFKQELAEERLQLIVDEDQIAHERAALEITLNGPTRAELSSYCDSKGTPILDPRTVSFLADVGEYMAIKKGDVKRSLDEMVEFVPFRDRPVDLLDGALVLSRDGPTAFLVRSGDKVERVTLDVAPPVIPFATLPPPMTPQTPMTFGIKALGTRSGFDLSGPTTGFLFWLNGRAVIYDGPVGTRYLLEQQGIPFSDVEAVVLSHCHEDHMGGFVELILSGHRPKVLTAEPIYRSLLVKLARYFGMPEAQVAAFIDYRRVTPGVAIDELGATFEFFYTVHAIPTIGMRISMKTPGGVEHSVQISGDTLHHEGLSRMKADGALDADKYQEMRFLIPETRVPNACFLADVGEALIHGHPKDWQGNPNRILYYHCPDNEHIRSFGPQPAVPGETYPLITSPSIHPIAPARLLAALGFLDFRDPATLANMLFRGHCRHVKAGEVLVQLTEAEEYASPDTLSVIVSGTAGVYTDNGEALTHLVPGEFFGAIELVDRTGRYTATLKAETPMELFDFDAALLHHYVRSSGLEEAVEKIWSQRPMVESARLFMRLEQGFRSRIAKIGIDESFAAGDVIIHQGALSDDFYLLVSGSVAIEIHGDTVRNLSAEDEDGFFGEISAIYPSRPRSATVKAIDKVRTLRVTGEQLRSLFEGHMGIRYALVVAISERGGQLSAD